MKIKAEKRDITGRKVSTLRAEDKVPASVYGPKRESTNITLDKKRFAKTFKEIGYNIIADLEIEGEKGTHKVLVKEVQSNPLTGDVQHVSLYQMDLTQTLDVEIPIEYIGESRAVKNGIGFLVTPVTEITVTCRPTNIPEKIVVDISNLNEINDAVQISELNLDEGVELHSSVSDELVLARISPPQKEIVEEVEETDEEAEEGEEGEEGTEGAEEGEETEQGDSAEQQTKEE